MYKILSLCLVCTAAPVEAQTVNVWLTTDDQKTLMQPQSAASFTEGVPTNIPTILMDERRRCSYSITSKASASALDAIPSVRPIWLASIIPSTTSPPAQAIPP
jgi:hypothetical protein